MPVRLATLRVQARAASAQRSKESPHRLPNEISSSVLTFTSTGSLPPISCSNFTSRASNEREHGCPNSTSWECSGGTDPEHTSDRFLGTTRSTSWAPGSCPIDGRLELIELRQLSYRNDTKRTLVDGPRLKHVRAANSFFTRMYYVARSTKSPMRVVEWRGEAWCVSRWQAHVRPDGFARLEGPDGSVELLLELDLGSEIRSRLEEKMERYRALARAATAPDVVVFCFPSEAREVSARQVLYGTPMPVATATLDRHLADPFGAIWLPLRDDRRVRLLDLRTGGSE